MYRLLSIRLSDSSAQRIAVLSVYQRKKCTGGLFLRIGDMMSSVENTMATGDHTTSPKTRKVEVISDDFLKAQIAEMISVMKTKNEKIRFVKLTENARTPTYGTKCSAGADLYSAYDCLIPAKGKAIVKTDLQIEIPYGYYGRVAPRSGLATKNFIDVGAGVIDSDYRGPLGVLLFNFDDKDFQVKKGDRIAQLICEKISHCEFVEMEKLEQTERGAGGFGSTGV